MGVERSPTHHAVVRVPLLLRTMRELSNPTHWNVLACLADEPKTVETIAAEMPIERATVSKSLSRLRQYGLVHFVRRKNNHLYSLNTETVAVRSDGRFVVSFETSDGSSLALVLSCDDLSGEAGHLWSVQTEVKALRGTPPGRLDEGAKSTTPKASHDPRSR